MKSKELEKQSVIKVDRWIDIGSEEFNNLLSDFDISLIKKWTKLGFAQPAFMIADELGHIWIKGEYKYHPFHDEFGKKIIGYRMATKAAN